jgi:hypothetical protein
VRLLGEAPPATVVTVQEDGGISVRQPGLSDIAGADRRRRPIATFVASHRPLLSGEVVSRIRRGLRKRGTDFQSRAVPS